MPVIRRDLSGGPQLAPVAPPASPQLWRIQWRLNLLPAGLLLAFLLSALFGALWQPAMPVMAHPAPAPAAQSSGTFERWVSLSLGDGDSDNNCTRTVEPGEDEDDPDVYIYDDVCRTIGRALEVAGPNDIIRIAAGTYNESLTIPFSLTIVGGYAPTFGQDVDPPTNPTSFPTTISGVGARGITIQGQTGQLIPPIISGEGPMQVTLRGLRIAGGSSGGIKIESPNPTGRPTLPNRVDVTLDNVVVSGNRGVTTGGGIHITGAGNKVTVQGGSISNNSATHGGGLYIDAGAQADLRDGTIIERNEALGGNGGGLAMSNALTVTTGGITLTGNLANSGGGGGVYINNSRVTIGSDTVVQSNRAANGAGIYVSGTGATVSSTALNSNIASSNGGGLYAAGSGHTFSSLIVSLNDAAAGGGVYLDNSRVDLLSSQILTNSATSTHGGGILVSGGTRITVTGNTIQANDAAQQGGGVYWAGTTAVNNFTGNTLIDNDAPNGGGGYFTGSSVHLRSNSYTGNSANSSGGGLYLTNNNSALQVSGESFTNNDATHGGGLYLTNNQGPTLLSLTFSENGASSGGGLYATANPLTTLGSATFIGNTSDDAGAGLYATGSTLIFTGTTQMQGNIAQGAGGGAHLATGSTLTFDTLDLIENEAANGGGLYIDGGQATIRRTLNLLGNVAENGSGGGAAILDTGNGVSGQSLTLTTLFAQTNKAATGGALYAAGVDLRLGNLDLQDNQATGTSGGGLYLLNTTTTVTGTVSLRTNQAHQHGGGLYSDGSTLTLQQGATFQGNRTTTGSGGGLYLTSSSAHSVNLGVITLEENNAAGDGGGLYATGVTLNLASGSRLVRNIAAGGSGGGMWLANRPLTLSGVTFDGNSAATNGGGLHHSGANLTLNGGSLFTDNRANSGSGGGLYTAHAAAVLVERVTFDTNQAQSDGGGLATVDSGLTAQTGVTLTQNTATGGRGGAIHVSGGSATLANLFVSGNTSGSGGGGIAATTGAFSLSSATLSENTGGTGAGGAAAIQATTAQINGNTFSRNLAASGGGLALQNTPNANLSQNNGLENSSQGSGGGLHIDNSTVGINRDTWRANLAAGDGAGLYIVHSRVEMTNTVVVRNRLSTTTHYAGGLYVGNSELTARHVTIADNSHADSQGTAAGIWVPTPLATVGGAPTATTLTLLNSLLSGQDIGLSLLGGNQATLTTNLWNNRGFDWTGDGTFAAVSGSRRGDPRFVNASGGDYRIRRDSAAFDRGIVTPVTVDRDGISRGQSLAPDLGAYEHRYNAGLYLTTSLNTRFVRNGDLIIMSLRVRNQSAVTATNVALQANLPAQLPTPGITTGSCQGVFCSANLGTLPPGSDMGLEISVQVGGTPAANALVSLPTNVILSTANMPDSDKNATLTAYLHSCAAEHNGTIYPAVQPAVDAASDGDTVRISGACGAVHQAGGPGQLLALNKSITLQGGWNSTFTTFNPTATPTYLDAAKLGRVVYITGGSPRLEHLTLRNGSAATLGGGFSGKDAGGGLYAGGASPTLVQVDITNNHSPDVGGGMYAAPGTHVQMTSGSLRSNSAGERGGGLYVRQAAPVFTDVNIAANQARGGGGVYLDQSAAQFRDSAAIGASMQATSPTCRIDANLASTSPRYVLDGSTVRRLSPGGGGGIVLDNSPALLRGCAVDANQAMVGGGVYLHHSGATIENSLLTNNVALTGSRIGWAGVKDGDGGGIALDYVDPTTLTLRGNMLGGNQGTRGSALFARLGFGGDLLLPHFTLHSNRGGVAVFALGESRLAFSHSIVAFNQAAPTTPTIPAVLAQNGSGGETALITLARTLWFPASQTRTGTANGGTVTTTDDVSGEPALRNDGYHIKRISAAYGIGAGDSSFADRDGTPRPVGAARDLGADEYATAVTVRYVALNGQGVAPCTDYRTPCGSLQTAIDASGDGDLIKMAGGTYSGVRNDGGRLHHARIDKSITIQGGYFPRTDNNTVTDGRYTPHDWEDPHPVENPTIIDVAVQGRALYITGNITPTLAYMTIRRGSAANLGGGPNGDSAGAGGAIYVDGANPTLRSIIIEESQATYGAGVYLRAANGTLEAVTLESNSATRGGAIYVAGGAPTLRSLTIRANSAITGAGVYLDDSAATLIANTLSNNGNAATLDGGGLFARGGASQVFTNSVSANQSLRGGGLSLVDTSATVRGNTIRDNFAGQESPPAGQDAGYGAGIYIAGGTPLIEANTVRGNRANHPTNAQGGGLYLTQSVAILRSNVISDNQAHSGGGIYITEADGSELRTNTLRANRTQAPDSSIRQAGGGLYIANASIDVTGNTFTANHAGYGAGLYIAGSGLSVVASNIISANVAAQDGGGLYLDNAGPQLTGNIVHNNRTSQGRGGGLYGRAGVATLQDNRFSANSAALEGGGLYLTQDSSTLRRDQVERNQAGDGGGLYIDGPAPDSTQSAPRLDHVTIVTNTATNHGGGLFLNATGAHIAFSTLRANQAAANGGGTYLMQSAPLTFNGNLIRANQAGDRGGGLFVTDETGGLYTSNVLIDNSPSGIHAAGATPVFVHTTLARNNTGLIAAPLNATAATVYMTNTIIAGHTLALQADGGTRIDLAATLWDGNTNRQAGGGDIDSREDTNGNADFAADGYHLHPSSDAAGRGILSVSAAGTDIDGENRLQGVGSELGADELTAPCSVIVAGNAQAVYSQVQQAVDAAPNGAELRIAGTCTDVVTRGGTPQILYVDKTLVVRGGYRPGDWENPDPVRQPSVLDARGLGRVVRLTGGRVTLENLTLINGSATGLGGGPTGQDAGGNLYSSGLQVTFSGLDVANGLASVGGGIYLAAPGGTLRNSLLRNNRALDTGGGLYLDNGSVGLTIQANRFTDNTAQDGGGLFVAGGNPPLIGNSFTRNQAGLLDGHGGGLMLQNTNAIVNRTQLHANRAANGGGIYVHGGAPNLTNNLLTFNSAVIDGAALMVDEASLDVRHHTLVGNRTDRDGGGALRYAPLASRSAVTLTNSILVDQPLAVSVTAPAQLLLRANLWHGNTTDWAGPGTVNQGQGNRFTDPGFVDAAGGDYHIAETSVAVDAGINAGVGDDIDGQNRPGRQAYDIGADEFLRPGLSANLQALPDPVAAGDQVSYLLQVVNTGDVDLTISIALTLPNQVTPNDTVTWANVSLPRGQIWDATVVGTVDADYTGTLLATLSAVSTEGASAIATGESTAAAFSAEILEISGGAAPNPATPGDTVEMQLRVVNNGAVPLNTFIEATLPQGLSTDSATRWTPIINSPNGAWSTKFNATLADNATQDLVTTVRITTTQGVSGVYTTTTVIARPSIQVHRAIAPRPAVAGEQIVYHVTVTNTGNVPLDATVDNVFPAQVALLDLTQGDTWTLTLALGAVQTRIITGVVEAGYNGPLAGSVQVSTDRGVGATSSDTVTAQRPSLTPNATARGGDWYDPATWEPPGVPAASDVVRIPADVLVYSEQPIIVRGLINRGTLELRDGLDASQELSVTQQLDNYGDIVGADATGFGAPGIRVELDGTIIVNEGTICGGDGAAAGGRGGELIIVAATLTNSGLLCGGDGADSPTTAGGEGGDVIITLAPGLLTNRGTLRGGAGGDGSPQGGDGGSVTLVATAAARLDGSTVLGGSAGAPEGTVGDVVVGAPRITTPQTRFSDGSVILRQADDTHYDFVAIGPTAVRLNVNGLPSTFTVRILNRSATTDGYVVSQLAAPTGWTVANLPATLNVPPFTSRIVTVRLLATTENTAENTTAISGTPDSSATETNAKIESEAGTARVFTIIVTSQRNPAAQIEIPLTIVYDRRGSHLSLPLVFP